ncbi:hypothetical protein E4U42_007956 [Claviceps africana]|uniref:RGS domain-containing protein n=1 Tax=Claviceps africana TaxID=83212 RepID=A0A8K0NEE4_9HYPO|nr:hypothetical protein E4U42_007956 [Claviceps africana]
MSSDFGLTPDTKPVARFDSLGVFWVSFAITWTVVLCSAILFLWCKRDMPILKVRGLGLSFAAIALLHFYWFAVTTAYVYGPLMPEVAEFWIMGIWLPFGVALFHASNTRFLYVAHAQKQYMKKTLGTGYHDHRPRIRKTLVARWQMLAYTNKVLIIVGLGMAFHLVLTVFTFLVSRKFHSTWGIPGTEVSGTVMEQRYEQGRGWEWWPSIFWQMFWAWVVAPVILWRTRGLQDCQGWRTQTIACCLSGLPAAPMWLVALYVPAMTPVNNYFIPPQWIGVSIMMLEIFTVFIPVWEVCKQQSLSRETLESIARWESRQKSAQRSGKSLGSGTSSTSWMSRTKAGSVSTTGGSIFTMDALEHTLARNPEPLQEFSALRDFSGENIAFLTRIRQWRAKYIVGVGVKNENDSAKTLVLSRECYESALHIYIDFISSNSAEFQVNLSSQDFKNLQGIFEGAARVVTGERSARDPVTPFDECPESKQDDAALARYTGPIPDDFNDGVFDDAEMSIKYLVLTNTWPKFIKARRSFDCSSIA